MKYEIELDQDKPEGKWSVRVVQTLRHNPEEVRTVFETTYKYSLYNAREQAMLAVGRAEKNRSHQ